MAALCFGLLWCFSAPTAFRIDVVSVWLHCVSVCCGVFSVRTAFRCAQAFFRLYSSVFRLCCGVVFCGYIIIIIIIIIIITIIIDIINVIIVILVLIIIIVPIVTIVVLMAQVGSCPFVTIARVLIVTMSLSWHHLRVMAWHRVPWRVSGSSSRGLGQSGVAAPCSAPWATWDPFAGARSVCKFTHGTHCSMSGETTGRLDGRASNV